MLCFAPDRSGRSGGGRRGALRPFAWCATSFIVAELVGMIRAICHLPAAMFNRIHVLVVFRSVAGLLRSGAGQVFLPGLFGAV